MPAVRSEPQRELGGRGDVATIDEVGPGVEVLAEFDGHPVLARDGRFLVASFHPELTDDTRLHELFLESVEEGRLVRA